MMGLMTHGLSTYWDDKSLRASPFVRSLRVGDRAVLFDEQTQKLYEQNTASADLWEAMLRHETLAAAALGLAPTPGDWQKVVDLARPAVLEWLRSGFLQPVALPAPASATTVVLEWLTCRLTVELPAGLDAAHLREVFRDFISDTPGLDSLRLQQAGDLVFFFDDRGGCYARHLDEWLPEVKAVFTKRILEASASGFLIHAALLSRSGSGLLICGSSGAGKSTLSLALSLSDFEYRADDIVHFDASGHAIGAPFAPALKEGSWTHFERMTGGVFARPTHLRIDGAKVRYVDIPQAERGPLTLGAILVLERLASGPARIEDIDRLDVLTSILQSAYSARGALPVSGLEALVQRIHQAKVGRLVYSDWSDAVQAISDFVL